MSRRRVVYFSGISGGEKVKLLGTHDKKPWVVFYSEHDHTLTLVDFSTRTCLARQTLQAIMQAAPVTPSSLPQSQTPEMRLQQQRRRQFEQQHRAVVDILFQDGNLDNKKASPAPSSHTSHSPEDTVALMLELGEVRHLSFTDCAAWQRQGTISSLHSGNFILIQTTNYVIFYDFFVHSTLFLSNLGAVVFRGIKYLGVAAGGRYRTGPGHTFATTPQGAHSSRSSFSSSTPTPSSQQEGSLGFNPTCCSFVDAGVLAIGCSDGSIRIWRLLNDLHRCKETTRWLAYRCEVACMQCLTSVPGFTRAKAWLVTVGADGVGYAWCANIPQTAVPAGMGMGFGGADLAWHTLDGTFTTLAAMAADARDSTNRDSLTAISNANSAIVAPIARFLTPSAPKTGGRPTYAAASATLSIVLADLSVYAVSMGPLFGVGAGGMGVMGGIAGAGAGEGGTGRGRSSSSNSSDGGRSSFSSLSSTPAAAHAHPANKAPGKRSGGILGGVSSLSLTKSLFSFVGKAESGSTSGGAVLFAAEEQSAVWAPLELGGLAVHSKNKMRHCVCALVGSRGEVMAATKASSVLLVCVGGGGGGGGGSGGTATASSSAPAPLTSLATHASDAREDTLLVRDEWNIQSAVSSFLGVDAQEDTEAGAGAGAGAGSGHAGAEKSIKLYALARACGPFVVLGTNRGIVVVLYHSALTPALRLVSHSSWDFALVAGGGASSSSRRVSKLTHSPQSSSSSGGGGGDGIVELSTTVQEQLDVLPGVGLAAADDGWTATVAPLQLIPSVSGKYFCLLFPTPTTRQAAGGLSGSSGTTSRADAPPTASSPSSAPVLSITTYVILAHNPLQEVERGSCCSFAWVGARDQYILTTVTAEPQPLPTASSTPPAASKRVSILNSMKGLLGGGKASKGGEVLRRKCVVKKAAVSAAPRASPGGAQEAVVVAFSSTPQPLRAGGSGSGGGGDSVVAFSGPVVFLTANAAVATVSRGAGGGGNYGAFYHFSSGSGSGGGGGGEGEGGGDAVAILSPISPSMPTPLDVQWTPCAGSRPGTTRALGACLFSSGSILIVGLGIAGAESNTVSSSASAAAISSASTSSSYSAGLILSCLFVVPFASPTSPLGFAPRIIWASSCGGNEARTVDMLHISTPAGSYMVAIPKQHGPACVLISNLLPLPKPDFGGEAIPTYLSPQGMLVYLTTPAFGVRISAQPTAALMACLHCGRQEEAEYWAALSRG